MKIEYWRCLEWAGDFAKPGKIYEIRDGAWTAENGNEYKNCAGANHAGSKWIKVSKHEYLLQQAHPLEVKRDDPYLSHQIKLATLGVEGKKDSVLTKIRPDNSKYIADEDLLCQDVEPHEN